MNKKIPLIVGILIFDDVEILDVTGPFEVFAVTRLDEERRQEESSPFRVLLVSENKDQVSAIGGLRFTPDVTKDNCPELDLLIVPGGMGTRTQVKNANLLKWIANKSTRTIRKDLRFTIDGPIFTSAGISAGIDMALHIVSYFFGTKVGEATAHQMEYPYPQNNKRSRNT
jgi:transcriptional regulator GlxA family with amidase domain